MRAELEVARQIQENLLRQSWPELDGMKVQACCYPAREVGGDFFEVYTHPQGDIWLAVGDVSGKGVPAALFMASAISVLRRELSQESPPEPNRVMQNLNRSLSDDLISANCFITMVLARYSPSTQTLVYANAGHIYPLVWSQQTVAEMGVQNGAIPAIEPNYLKVRGIPLGILPDWKAAAGTLDLKSGEVLLLTSDGITEATVEPSPVTPGSDVSQSSSMLQQTGLWKLLIQQQGPLDLSHLLARIRSHNAIQEDDQTLLSLEVL
jgi:serine phosphatase RsbU (regulator of sigma subunit)